jgi:maltose alpha-D-glucosyltransferase/alpha-amylase
MGRYLTEQGFANTPPLLGEMVRIGADGTRHALAIAQGFVRNQGDAWSWTLDLLVRGLSDLASGDEAALADAERHQEYAHFARLLGQRLGEMHAILARPSDEPAFAPEQAGPEVAAQWSAQAGAQLEAAFKALDGHKEWDQKAGDDLSLVGPARGCLFGRIHELAASSIGARMTRIHGDLHLGQLLVANGDVYIIDFEGEPAKPAAVRRAKNHRMRDVAGMIRSFDYAAAVTQRKSIASHAHVPDARRDSFLASFVATATEAFLSGYHSALGNPAEADAGLLDLFLLEKAAYEVTYEAANRPGWIDVPLRGLAQLAARLCAPAEQTA